MDSEEKPASPPPYDAHATAARALRQEILRRRVNEALAAAGRALAQQRKRRGL